VLGALLLIYGHELHTAFARALSHVQGGKVVYMESKMRKQSVKEQRDGSSHYALTVCQSFLSVKRGLENFRPVLPEPRLCSRSSLASARFSASV